MSYRDYDIDHEYEITMLSTRKLVARKQHECSIVGCKRPIAVGEAYFKYAYLDDSGAFRSDKQHVSHYNGEEDG